MSAILVPNRFLPQMVTRTYYEDDEQPFRRYNSKGHGYPLSDDRELSSGPNHNVYSRQPHPGGQDPRNGNRSPDQDEIPRTRSRIPVACGRCRKRKIKCSGDNGGGPCSNCKSAGSDQCQFLRVSSHDTPLKSETSPFDLDPSSAGSRLNCRMVPFGPYYHASQAPSLTFDSYSFRGNSVPSYQYGPKSYYPLPSYNQFGDEGVDYGLQCQLLPGDQMGIGSNYTPVPARTWASTPQPAKSLPFLGETAAPMYNNHGQSTYNGMPNFDLRSDISPESKVLPLAGLNQPLPAPVSVNAGMDRLLPIPAPVPVVRPPPVNQYLPPAENLLTGTQNRGSYIDNGTVHSLKSNNNNALYDNVSIPNSSYMPVTNPSAEPMNTTQATYTANSYSMASRQPDIYNSPQNSNDGLLHPNETSSSYGHSDNNNGSPYAHRSSNGSEKREYHSSQGGCDGLPSLTNGPGTLANGHRYVFAPSGLASNQHGPAPPIENHPQPRRQSGVLA